MCTFYEQNVNFCTKYGTAGKFWGSPAVLSVFIPRILLDRASALRIARGRSFRAGAPARRTACGLSARRGIRARGRAPLMRAVLRFHIAAANLAPFCPRIRVHHKQRAYHKYRNYHERAEHNPPDKVHKMQQIVAPNLICGVQIRRCNRLAAE